MTATWRAIASRSVVLALVAAAHVLASDEDEPAFISPFPTLDAVWSSSEMTADELIQVLYDQLLRAAVPSLQAALRLADLGADFEIVCHKEAEALDSYYYDLNNDHMSADMMIAFSDRLSEWIASLRWMFQVRALQWRRNWIRGLHRIVFGSASTAPHYAFSLETGADMIGKAERYIDEQIELFRSQLYDTVSSIRNQCQSEAIIRVRSHHNSPTLLESPVWNSGLDSASISMGDRDLYDRQWSERNQESIASEPNRNAVSDGYTESDPVPDGLQDGVLPQSPDPVTPGSVANALISLRSWRSTPNHEMASSLCSNSAPLSLYDSTAITNESVSASISIGATLSDAIRMDQRSSGSDSIAATERLRSKRSRQRNKKLQSAATATIKISKESDHADFNERCSPKTSSQQADDRAILETCSLQADDQVIQSDMKLKTFSLQSAADTVGLKPPFPDPIRLGPELPLRPIPLISAVMPYSPDAFFSYQQDLMTSCLANAFADFSLILVVLRTGCQPPNAKASPRVLPLILDYISSLYRWFAALDQGPFRAAIDDIVARDALGQYPEQGALPLIDDLYQLYTKRSEQRLALALQIGPSLLDQAMEAASARIASMSKLDDDVTRLETSAFRFESISKSWVRAQSDHLLELQRIHWQAVAALCRETEAAPPGAASLAWPPTRDYLMVVDFADAASLLDADSISRFDMDQLDSCLIEITNSLLTDLECHDDPLSLSSLLPKALYQVKTLFYLDSTHPVSSFNIDLALKRQQRRASSAFSVLDAAHLRQLSQVSLTILYGAYLRVIGRLRLVLDRIYDHSLIRSHPTRNEYRLTKASWNAPLTWWYDEVGRILVEINDSFAAELARGHGPDDHSAYVGSASSADSRTSTTIPQTA